jgi:hypothetical protein
VVLVNVGEQEDPAISQMAVRCGIKAETLVAVQARGAKNFGRAVAEGLKAVAMAPAERIFLLHDDAFAATDCLEKLSRAIEFAPSVVIAGPKQLRVDLPGSLGEVGVTTSRFGRRMTGAEDGELDQGQYDHREDMLGVGSAGMLVRADAWAELRGFDPALGPFRDGLDLSRRARLAGYRVIVVPDAVIHHEQASFRGLRARSRRSDPRRSFGARRRAFIHTQLVHCPLPLMPLVAAAAVISGVARTLWRLARKDIDLMVTELVAPWAVLANPARLAASRRLASASRRLRRSTLRPLLTTNRDVRAMHRDRRLARAEAVRLAEAPSEVELADRSALAAARRVGKTIAWAVAVLATLVSLGHLLSAQQLVGGAASRLDLSVSAVWQWAFDPVISQGLGHSGPADPFSWVLAFAQTISWGHGVLFLTITAPLLAAIGAWYAAGAAARSVAVRVWASIVYLAAPSLWLSLADGRLGAAVTHAIIPWILLTSARCCGLDRRDLIRRAADQTSLAGRVERSIISRRYSVSDAAAAGLLAAIAVAGTPLLLPVLLLGVVAALVVTRFQWRLLLVMVIPLLLSIRQLRAAWQQGSWRVFLGDPGLPLPHQPTSLRLALLGWPADPVVPASLPVLTGVLLAVSGLLVLVALLALLRPGPRAWAARFGWLISLFALLGVFVAGRVPTTAVDGVMVTPWAGGLVSLVQAGLLLAATAGADGAAAWLVTVGGARRLEAGVLACVMMAGPLLVLADVAWQWRSDRQIAVTGQGAASLPAIAAHSAQGQDQTSTLLLNQTDGVTTWQVVRGIDVSLDQWANVITADRLTGSLTDPAVADQPPHLAGLSQLVANMVGGSGRNVAESLSAWGIGFCFVPAGNKTLLAALDATEGLARAAETSRAGVAWRVGDAKSPTRAAWAELVEPDGSWTALPANSAVIEPGQAGRVVRLAQVADPAWRATVGGQTVSSTDHGWQQAFEVPASGGRLLIWQQADRLVTFQLTVLLVALVLALPRRRATAEDV